MAHLISKRAWVALSVLLLMLFISVYASQAAEITPITQAAPTAEATLDPVEMTFGPGTFDLVTTTIGLSTLSSYRATLTLSFKGTRDAKSSQWKRTYIMVAAQQPATRLMTIDTTGQAAAQMIMAEVDGTSYMQQGKGECNASAVENGTSFADTWEPANFLTGVVGADDAGTDTVNTIATKHYTFDERALGQQDIAQSTGELWVAADGGYIVKYLLTTKGGASYFREGVEGTMTWDYELTDIAKPVTIKLPVACPPGMVNAPQLPDATDVLNVPGLLSYATTTSAADAVVFYQTQLPTLGWKQLPASPSSETAFLLYFTRAKQQLSLIISTDGASTSVHILLRPGK